VETALPVGLEITLDPEQLSEGLAEEKAAFGLFVMRAEHRLLTEGFDAFIGASRKGPLVSGYHVAEWFAWNWWRLRWEGRSAAPDWGLAHKMTSIGEGYVWPNVTIFSDSVRTALISAPSDPDAKPFRYLGALPTVVTAREFEAAVDAFVPKILARVDAAAPGSNLARTWADVLAERADPEIAKRRRLEAFLGRDPDSVDDDAVERLLADRAQFGDGALIELAAEAAQRGPNAAALSAGGIVGIIDARGFEGSPRDSVRLDAEHKVVPSADVPAWLVGVRAARALRDQEKLGLDPISNDRLARMAGVDPRAVTEKAGGAEMSFALDRSATDMRLVLRSKWDTGRRFDLARLLGDRVLNASGGLHPATRASTYRQKAQRAFSAELLSPFEAVDAMLQGDYSIENQEEVADHFHVSGLTVDTLLKNHGRIPRDDVDYDFDAADAA
jgi:hypothetical protein